MTARVFVSYSQDDKAAYSSLCLALDSSGVSRWDVSALPLGKSLAESLRSAIDECDLCIFIATARSLNSKWCLAELGAFWGASKRVIVFLADPDIAGSDLPPQFQGNLWTTNALQLIEAVRAEEASPIRRTIHGYCFRIGAITFHVNFGRIESFKYDEHDSLVALPANEFFDDECIDDPRSALGAFMQHNFPGKTVEIQGLVRTILSAEKGTKIEKRPGEYAKSLGIGKCAYLDRPLSSNLRVAMVAVTTQRANEGLRADASFIFEAARSLSRLMVNQRLTRLHIPILGSGHGGLNGEVSLVCMLIAFGELHRRSSHNLREINIVVFRSDQGAATSIPEASVKRALHFAARFLSG